MIRCADGVLEAIREHARRAYPHEACGALVGRTVDGGIGEVVRAVPAENERANGRERRYLISPGALRQVEAQAASDALAVLGFYHSHPDQPAVPSEYDREYAWPWYAYVIVEVRNGETDGLRAWRLADDRSSFLEEELVCRKEEET